MLTLGALAKKEFDDFKLTRVKLEDGDFFSQYDNIKRINLYTRSKFLDCPDTTALFWNISNERAPLYAKSIDLDTKNFAMVGIGKFNWFKAMIANARFKRWARNGSLGSTLDIISKDISVYGSCVLKKSYNKIKEVTLEPVKLNNLAFNQKVDNIIDSPVVEPHYLSETEIRNKYPDLAEKILETAERLEERARDGALIGCGDYILYERWGEYNDGEDVKYIHWFGCGQGDTQIDIINDEIKLDKEFKPVDFPYYDFHGERVPGRWQGLGVVERLFETQEQVNKLVNQNDEANEIATLLLFKSDDPETEGNIKDTHTSGQIVRSMGIEQMPIDNRALNGFLAQLQVLEAKADRLCYITETVSGDTPPSGVPFRSIAVAAKASKSTFTFIKTTIGIKMAEVLKKDIMPDVVNSFKKEDLFNIMEDEVDVRLYDEAKIEQELNKWMKRKVSSGRDVIFEEEIMAKREQIKKKLERGGRVEKLEIDFDWGIVMDPTGESVDKAIQNEAIDSAIAQMTANPAIVNSPLFKQKLENNGIPPFRLTNEETAMYAAGGTAQMPAGQMPTDKLSQLANEQ